MSFFPFLSEENHLCSPLSAPRQPSNGCFFPLGHVAFSLHSSFNRSTNPFRLESPPSGPFPPCQGVDPAVHPLHFCDALFPLGDHVSLFFPRSITISCLPPLLCSHSSFSDNPLTFFFPPSPKNAGGFRLFLLFAI